MELPLQTLNRGEFTISQQFAILRSAIKELKDSHESEIPWELMWNMCLDSFESTLNHPTPAIIPSNTIASADPASSQDTEKDRRMLTKALSITSKKTRATDATAHPKPSPPPIPADQEIQQVAKSLHNEVLKTSPLYDRKGQKYVRCTRTGCRFCKDMFMHLNISSCERMGHEPCHSTGWFPHIGITMWKVLRRQHDSGSLFIPKMTQPKAGELPCLSRVIGSVEPHNPPTEDHPNRKRPNVAPITMDTTPAAEKSPRTNWSE